MSVVKQRRTHDPATATQAAVAVSHDARVTVRDTLSRYVGVADMRRREHLLAISSDDASHMLTVLRNPRGRSLLPWTQLPPV